MTNPHSPRSGADIERSDQPMKKTEGQGDETPNAGSGRQHAAKLAPFYVGSPSPPPPQIEQEAAPSVWVVSGSSGADFVADYREAAMEHAAEVAEVVPELGPWRVREYRPAPSHAAVQGEDDATARDRMKDEIVRLRSAVAAARDRQFELEGESAEQRGQIAALRHDIERQVAIASEYAMDAARYQQLNTPELHDFREAVLREALYQRELWGTEHDAGKEPQDWFWLIGYLAGKALRSHIDGDVDKAMHHTITVAAACANWHGAITGATNMRPGIAPPAAALSASTEKRECWCRTCRPITLDDMRMALCPECGNKRCPHATDHRNACTGSNDPGQTGSVYA